MDILFQVLVMQATVYSELNNTKIVRLINKRLNGLFSMYRYYREEHATDTARVGHFCNGDAARVGVKVALTCGEAVRIGVKVAHMWRSC